MSTKRPHSSSQIHPSRRSNVPITESQPPKRRRPNPPDPTNPTSRPSTGSLRSQIRSLTRLLSHNDNLPADVRIEKERALTGYQHDLDVILKDRQKSQMIKKYHMVRFFERQKASRILKKLQKRLGATVRNTDEHRELDREIHKAEVDLNYTLFYPLGEKYLSLYPRTEEGERDSSGGNSAQGDRKLGERPPIWLMVEKRMADGTLDALRDGKVSDDLYTKSKPNQKTEVSIQKPLKQKPASKNEDSARKGGGRKPSDHANMDETSDSASDGGFFEK